MTDFLVTPPTPSQLLFEQAKVHVDRGEEEAALDKLSQFLNHDFNHAEALFMLGSLLIHRGSHGLGAVLTKAAIEAREGKFCEAYLNLGMAYKSEFDNETAEKVWKIGLGLTPDNQPRQKAMYLANMAGLHLNEGSPAQGLVYAEQALKCDPTFTSAIWHRGMAHLELGNWRQGWLDHESRFESLGQRARPYPKSVKPWEGEKGQHVVVWGDQGVGDEILYASMLPDLIRDCASVTLECHPRLPRLFERSFPGLKIHGTRKVQSAVDWIEGSGITHHLSISSLGRFYRNANSEFPGTPYLKADPERANYYRRRGDSRLRVGIAWTGGTKKTRTDLRSIPLADLEPILRTDADLYSLQYTPGAAREVCDLEEKTGIRVKHWPSAVECVNYDETASFVASMDLVITVCTTVYHMAGSLGVPVWCMVPARPAWRYGVTGETSLWYRSARLFRQIEGEPWSNVIERIAGELVQPTTGWTPVLAASGNGQVYQVQAGRYHRVEAAE